MKRSFLSSVLLLCLSVMTACVQSGSQPGETTATAPEVNQSSTDRPEEDKPEGTAANVQESGETDSPKAKETLESLGARFKYDGDGLIVEVDLRGANVDDTILEFLHRLPHVRSLLLGQTGVTDKGLVTLSDFATLTHLDLRDCPLTNTGLNDLAKLSDLRALRLSGKSGATQVDDEGLAFLAKITKLRALALDFLWVSEAGLAKLTQRDSLEELYLAGTLTGDETLAVLIRFSNLRKLRIAQTGVTNSGLAHLTKLSQLAELDLSENSHISDDGLAHLASMRRLTHLNLWRLPVTDAGIAHLVELINLESLNLDNTGLTDAGLTHLRGMQKLKFLHLGSTEITDAGLEHLEKLSALRDLKVTRTAVTSSGVAELEQSLPQTEIQLRYVQE